MIVVTGAAGFISSCLVAKLNLNGFTDLVLVDDFSIAAKRANWEHKKYRTLVERDVFFEWLKQAGTPVFKALSHAFLK